MKWIFEPSDDIEQSDDNHLLKGTNFCVQACLYGGAYSVNENLLDSEGKIVFHKEFKTLDAAKKHAEKLAKKR